MVVNLKYWQLVESGTKIDFPSCAYDCCIQNVVVCTSINLKEKP